MKNEEFAAALMFNGQCSMVLPRLQSRLGARASKNVQCSMFNVQCSMFNGQCSMFNGQNAYWTEESGFLKAGISIVGIHGSISLALSFG